MRSLAAVIAGVRRRGRVLRVAAAALAALGLLSVAIFGGETPLWAQEAESTGVGISLGDLSDYPTHLTVDGFMVELSNLTAAEDYQVTVSSDSANVGIGGCGTTSQQATVTGVAERDLVFVVYACTVGEATVTAEVRRTGAASPEASVSRRLTVEAIPENAIGARGERVPPAAAGAVPKVGTPGSVPNTYFDQRYLTSVRANWGTPSDGGPDTPLTGFGLLFWEKDNPVHPGYDDPLVLGPNERMYTYENLQPDTTYNFQIHACNGPDSCGYWTVPIVEVKTAGPPKKPHTISVDEKKGTSARVNWRPEADTGGPDVSLTGFGIRWREEGDDWPSQAQGVVNRNKRSHVMSGLTKNTTYEVSLQSCNGDNSCSAWTSPLEFRTPGMLPSPPAPTNLAAGTATDSSVPLTWDALTGAAKYRVENRPGDSGAWTEHDDDIGGTSLTVDGLSCGTSHQFRVTAYGNGTTYAAAWGTASAVLTASTSASGCTLPSPPAPTNLAAGTVTDRSVPLSWNAVANATKYRVEYRVSGTTAWTTDDETLTTLMHTVDELSCGTAYEFGVSAYGDGTNHLAQWGTRATTSATTGGCVPGMISVPGPVTGVRFPEADLSDTSFKVTWTAPSSNGGAAITKYEVNWVAGQTNQTESVTGPSGLSPPTEATIDADVKPATAYVVKVRACNGPSRCSPWPTDGRVATTRPSQVQNLSVQAGDGQLIVSWSALESNLGNLAATRSNTRFLNPSARLFYQVQYRAANVRAWPADDDYTAGSITSLLRTSFSGLASGVRFLVRSRGLIDLTGLGPELQLPVRLAGTWSAVKSATLNTKLDSPEVIARPLTGRRFRLEWNSVPNANSYLIKRVIGGREAAFKSVPSTSPLLLMMTLDNELREFEDSSFIYTITALDSNDNYPSSKPSKLIVAENLIARINGGTLNSAGESVAEVRWPSIPGATSYTIHYRKLAGDHDHSRLDWMLPSPYLREADEASPWEEVDVTPPLRQPVHFTHAIGPLDRESIYGVYLTYTKVSKQFGSSAREMYVWPSDRSADGGQRVATIPLTSQLHDGTYPNPRTFGYRVCFSLFSNVDPLAASPATIGQVKQQWTKVVEDALLQWQIATDNLVIMDRLDESDRTESGELLHECADYDLAIAKAAERYGDSTDGPVSEAQLKDFFKMIEILDYYTDATTDDAEANEVIIVNFRNPDVNKFRAGAVFSQVSRNLGFAGCLFVSTNGSPCASPSGEHDQRGRLTDILIPTNTYTPLPDPVDVMFNKCMADGIANSVIRARFVKNYSILVHEAGHALGISGGHGDADQDGDDVDEWEPLYVTHHSTIAESVVSYKGINLRRIGQLILPPIPACSPYALDVMAMYALYQSANRA